MYARDYAYRKNADGYLQSREKGIDVRLACEIVAAAAKGEIDGVLIWSADQDLSEAVSVAKELAASAGRTFSVYCVEIDGTNPLQGAIPIKLTRPILYRHLRSDEGEKNGDVALPVFPRMNPQLMPSRVNDLSRPPRGQSSLTHAPAVPPG